MAPQREATWTSASDWNQTCPNGLLLVTGEPEDPENWAIYASGKERLYVLDLPSGDTVTIVIAENESGTDFRKA